MEVRYLMMECCDGCDLKMNENVKGRREGHNWRSQVVV